MSVLAIDPGQRRVGLAISDDDCRIALPLATIERRSKEQVLDEIADAVVVRNVSTIVLGLPLRLDGSEGLAARTARAFGTLVAKRTSVPVVYWDERLTTAAANRVLRMTGRSARQARQVIDQAAAVVLLQGYLDAHRERDA